MSSERARNRKTVCWPPSLFGTWPRNVQLPSGNHVSARRRDFAAAPRRSTSSRCGVVRVVRRRSFGQREIRNDKLKKEDPDRNGPGERTGFRREPRIREPAVGWPQRPRRDDERREHQRHEPRKNTVASQHVRRNGTREEEEGTRVRPFLEPREPGRDDRDGPTHLPHAQDVAE